MKRILRWVLVAVMCLGLCAPAWAAPVDGPSDADLFYALEHAVIVDSLTWKSGRDWSFSSPVFVFIATTSSDSGESIPYFVFFSKERMSFVFKNDSGAIVATDEEVNIGQANGFFYYSYSLYDYASVQQDIPFYDGIYSHQALNDALLVFSGGSGGGSGENSDYAYDASIPAPQNLKLDFIKTNVGILGLSKRTDLQLSWSNALVDEYSVQISAAVTMEFTPGEGNQTHGKKTFTHKLVGLSQLDSGGSDAGFPAKTGKYTITEDELKEIAEKQLGDGPYVLERAYVDSFRVQFYKIDSGVVNVGPIGVVNLSYSILGKYQGSTTTIEYPKDASDVGTGGLMPDDSGLWGGDGSGLEYDENGNITGSTDGSGSASWSDALKSLLDGLVNIPTIIARLFDSLTSMLSGVSQFPALLGSLFSFLPQEITNLIGLGLLVVIVLRIVGR